MTINWNQLELTRTYIIRGYFQKAVVHVSLEKRSKAKDPHAREETKRPDDIHDDQ